VPIRINCLFKPYIAPDIYRYLEWNNIYLMVPTVVGSVRYKSQYALGLQAYYADDVVKIAD
jgi:hypothetical protein